MRSDFIVALEKVAADNAVRALVLTGAGKGFCAGGDVAGMQRRMDAPAGEVGFNGWSRQQRVHHSVSLLHTMPKPVIAAVNGGANGLGADMAMACDFVLACDAASFAWSYIKRGLIPDGGGMYFLPRRVGLARAKELIFTGRKVEPDEALRLGIADRVTSAQNLLADAQAWATRTVARLGGRDRAGQVDPEPELRVAGRAGVRQGQPGAGHLLHHAAASRRGAGLPERGQGEGGMSTPWPTTRSRGS
jgi:enoyl-CoA hydratase/carnithine racemase